MFPLRHAALAAFGLLLLLPLASSNYVIFSQRYSADPAPIVHKVRSLLCFDLPESPCARNCASSSCS